MLLIKLLFLIAILLVLVRLKVSLFLSMLAISVVFFALYGLSFAVAWSALREALIGRDSLLLYGNVVGITYAGNLLAKRGNFRTMLDEIRKISGDKRFSLAVAPALIGLVPMPGGALFSAPIVEEGGRDFNLAPHEKHLINYLFRHMWEFMLPAYQAILLINATFAISLSAIIVNQSIFTLIFTVLAFFFTIFPIKAAKGVREGSIIKGIIRIVGAIWPVLLIVAGIIANVLPAPAIIAAVIVAVFIAYRIKPKEAWKSFVESLSPAVFGSVVAIMFFKELIQQSGAFTGLSLELVKLSIPTPVVLFLLPFLVSFLTGLTLSGVGVSFPVLLSLYYIDPHTINYIHVILSYLGAFLGVMASPTHLCMSLTKDYFKADFPTIYRKLLPLLALFGAIAVGILLLGFPLPYNVK